MKLEIFDESKKKEEKFFLKLDGPDLEGDFRVLVVDEYDQIRDVLLYLGPRGIMRSVLVNRKWGFQCDDNDSGRIKVRFCDWFKSSQGSQS